MEAAKDHQQLPQVNRVQNPVFNESVTSAVLVQQLPPLPKFSGGEVNNGGMYTFQDWLEQFEMIAIVCGWSPQARLVNLVTRLEGQAYAFFRSCTTQHKTSYALLVADNEDRGFNLRKWRSNSCTLQQQISEAEGEADREVPKVVRVLGLNWNTQEDCLVYKLDDFDIIHTFITTNQQILIKSTH